MARRKNKEAARVWISGLEAVNRNPGRVAGDGSVGDAVFPQRIRLRGRHAFPVDYERLLAHGCVIECGIVKLPRVPVADNIPGADVPMFRNLWEHIGKQMPKKRRGKNNTLDPLSLPPPLQTELEALYGHYEKTFELWDKAGI